MSERPTPLDILRDYWGYEQFRPMQADIINSVLDGYDTLALMPTGGGKSITFQVPGLILPGLCIVITPLIALMKDQVDGLRKLGIKATMLHSGLRRMQTINVLDNCLYGDYKFLYLSPERLQNEFFLMRLTHLNISMIVVDESHCVSQWGYDFRPSYLKINEFRTLLPGVPLLALTATATPRVAQDIREKLAFGPKQHTYQRSFYRSNLSYVVRRTADKPRELLHILERVQGSGLVYVRSRKKTKEYAALLTNAGISADYYHAGLSTNDKVRKQNAWQNEDIRVMVCTNAFGMGIDKDNVRIVVHPEAPPSPEYYYQEAGRAGRDNKRAFAVLLYDPNYDPDKLLRQLDESYPPVEALRDVYDALGNFFQVAVGHGADSLHELNLPMFCHFFKFSLFQVLSSLSLLTLGGYLQSLEDHAFSSRLMFVVDRNELYNMFDETQVIFDDLVEAIMREYPGVFSEYQFIDEQLLCQRLNVEPKALYELLISLRRWHIIDYVPGKRGHYVRYPIPRVEKEEITMTKEVYQLRYKGEHQRLMAMIDYMEERDKCRVMLLMDYFGEEEPLPCGWCDYCLAHTKAGELTYRKIDEVKDLIFHQPSETLPGKSELCRITGLKPRKLEKALTFLKREGYILPPLSDDEV